MERSKNDRNKQITSLYRAGFSMQEIADEYNITRQRVQGIIIKGIEAGILSRFGRDKNDLRNDEIELLDIAIHEEIDEIHKSNKLNKEIKMKEEATATLNKLTEEKIAFTSIEGYKQALGLDSIHINKFFPDLVKQVKEKNSAKWSKYHSRCVHCQRDDTEHVALGLCRSCYITSPHFKEIVRKSHLKYRDRIKEQQKEYLKKYYLRPEVKQRQKDYHDEYNFDGNRRLALERDQFKCSFCGLTKEGSLEKYGRDLYVERVKPDKGNVLENLITSCKGCHIKHIYKSTHKR